MHNEGYKVVDVLKDNPEFIEKVALSLTAGLRRDSALSTDNEQSSDSQYAEDTGIRGIGCLWLSLTVAFLQLQ